MYQYIIKRFFLMIPTLVGVAVLVFILMRLIPGDICVVRVAGDGGSFDQDSLDLCRIEFGLNDPLFIQFFNWLMVNEA